MNNSIFKNIKFSRLKDAGLIFSVTAFFVVTLCIFGPLELYFSNVDSLWFTVKDSVISILLPSVLSFIIILLIYFFLGDKYKINFITLIFSITLGLYVQGNFMNIRYGVLDGNSIAWEEYRTWAIINTLIWIAIVAIPFIIKRYKLDIFKKLVQVLSCVIVLIQIITLTTLFLTVKGEESTPYFLSEDNMLKLSSRKNVIVFVLDTFDDSIFKEILENDSNYIDKLEGFTYFSNSVGSYPTTRGALPFILTQKYYKNEEPIATYVEKAYKETNFYKDLYKNNFDIQILTLKNEFVDQKQSSYISNIEQSELKVSSHNKLSGKLYKFTAYRYMPHLLKKYFWFYSGEFNELKESRSTAKTFSSDNLDFYDKLINDRIKIVDNKNAFRFYHLDGVHPPYNLKENLEKSDDVTAVEQAKATLNIVYEYINQMKKEGIYDDSTIIIMSDHGITNISSHPRNPVFLIKSYKHNSGFYINNNPISHANFHASIMDELNLDYKEYGVSVFEEDKSLFEKRKFMYYNWDNSWDSKYLPDIYEYEVGSKSNDMEEFSLTGYMYAINGIKKFDISFPLNDTILFNNDTNISYFLEGVSKVEKDFVWTLGKKGKLKFHIDKDNDSDLKFKLEIERILGNSQRLIISSGEKILYDDVLTGKKNIEFLIPKELIEDKNLVLNLEYPDAVSPKEITENSTDKRVLAFALKSMCIEEVNKE